MQISEAINLIEGVKIPEHINKAKNTIKNNLENLSENDYEGIATHYYYLLRILLKQPTIFETAEAFDLYHKMTSNFLKQENKYNQELKTHKNKTVIREQFDIFYQLVEKYYASLVMIYNKKSLHMAYQKAYKQKMNFRKNSYYIQKKYSNYVTYLFLELSSDYGFSFFRWGIISIMFITIFAGLYAIGYLINMGMLKNINHWYDFIYFSVTTFTTLGYGDIAPLNLYGKIISNIEACCGYLMLGTLMVFLQKKLS